MSRQSAFSGTWTGSRPFISMSPDSYVTFQGETTITGCGDCKRQISFNDYITSVSSEASIDSPPGGCTITMTVPDNDVNDFYVDGQFTIIPMMEIEVYSKGYFLVGGVPQYYRTFWGIVQSVSSSWSNGTTTITISCKDILRWWELTNTTTQPGFIESFGSSTGNFTFWGNQFSGTNPYTVIISLARESMGDFSLTTGSFTSFLPEKGPEGQIIGSYAKDVMAYWQLKFGNIWNSLVMYGTSGQAYTFTGTGGTVSPIQISEQIFAKEDQISSNNPQTGLFKIQPSEIAVFKKQLDRAADFELFQNETQSKLSIAMQARDQAGYEFFCDCNGDIVFKPPFYNLNVMPNKPVSWIQDFEIIEDNIEDNEAEVYTHVTSSGNAFGGVMDWGLNDEITTPRSGVIDFHLLRRYGWRRLDYQLEWPGNPRKLFFHLLDYIDRINAKRVSGTITIPLRPELRMGFPIWIPKWDSFFYIAGLSHQYSVGGQATTTVTLTAKRSKFIAPKNIGILKKTGTQTVPQKQVLTDAQQQAGKTPRQRNVTESTFSIKFPDRAGSTTGLTDTSGEPSIVRDNKTGRILGFTNAVMVFRSGHKGENLAKIVEQSGKNPNPSTKAPGQKGSKKPNVGLGKEWTYRNTVANTFKELQNENRAVIIAKMRAHRYEAGMTNAGAYDYAFDSSRSIQELILLPTSAIDYGTGTGANSTSENPNNPNPGSPTADVVRSTKTAASAQTAIAAEAKAQQVIVNDAKTAYNKAVTNYNTQTQILAKLKKFYAQKNPPAAAPVKDPNSNSPNPITPAPQPDPPDITDQAAAVQTAKMTQDQALTALNLAQQKLTNIKLNQGPARYFPDLNIMVRPVSDEFGFETIGHYRYGRGVFVDRGQITVNVNNPQGLANQLSIQFAPQGGLLTDSSPGSGAQMGPQSANYSGVLEQMQPDDYTTGASFSGTSAQSNQPISDVVKTSQQTYTNLVNANTGKGVYIEADTLAQAKSLSELSPTSSTPGIGDDLRPCSCMPGRPSWFSVLPTTVIEELFDPTGTSGISATSEGINQDNTSSPEYTNAINSINADQKQQIADFTAQTNSNKKLSPTQKTAAIAGFTDTINASTQQRLSAVPKTTQDLQTTGADPSKVFTNNISATSFFAVLQNFLHDKFKTEYEANNAIREQHYTVQDNYENIPILDANTSTSDVIGDPQNPLFNRAAMGDPAALQALKNEANFNFGMSVAASSAFPKIASSAAASATPGLSGLNPFSSQSVVADAGVISIPSGTSTSSVGSTSTNSSVPKIAATPVIGLSTLYNSGPRGSSYPTDAQLLTDQTTNKPVVPASAPVPSVAALNSVAAIQPSPVKIITIPK